MATTSSIITTNIFFWSILGSSVVATIVGVLLTWLKEYIQKKVEKEQRQFEKLYGALTYHLLAMKVLKINRTELLDEIVKEPTPDDIKENIKRFMPVNPLILKWNEHKDKLMKILENNAGYLKKSHIKFVEDFLDGCVKRDITENGESIRVTPKRIEKMIDAVRVLQDEILGKE
jgi:hypothetical protein